MWLVGLGGNLWVLLAGGVSSGCGCKEVYIFPHYLLFIPTPLVSALFAAASPTFGSFFMFFVLVPTYRVLLVPFLCFLFLSLLIESTDSMIPL